MLARIADLVIRRRRAVLVGAVVVFALGGAIGGGVAEHLSAGGFDDPSSESYQADQILLDRFDAGMPNIVLLVTAPGTPGGEVPAVDAPDAEAAGLALTAQLDAIPEVTNVVSYWSIGKQAPLRSQDGTHALVIGRILGTQDQVDERIREIVPQLEGAGGVLEVEITGYAEIFHQVSEQIESRPRPGRDDRPAHHAAPAAVRLPRRGRRRPAPRHRRPLRGRHVPRAARPSPRSPRCRSSPSTSRRRWASACRSTTPSSSSTASGRSSGTDTSPPRPSAARSAPPDAPWRSRAGTVAASLLALLVFPIAFLKSFAYAGVAVAGLAGLFSVVVLPAMLAALGHRVNALPLRRRRGRSAPRRRASGTGRPCG